MDCVDSESSEGEEIWEVSDSEAEGENDESSEIVPYPLFTYSTEFQNEQHNMKSNMKSQL